MMASPPATPTPRPASFQTGLLPVVVPRSGLQNRPALPSSAFARFEFESGRGNEGTKILMVEWEDEIEAAGNNASSPSEWEISWDGKSTVVSARDEKDDKLRRLYFLLPPATTVPRVVKLSQPSGRTMHTTPLPAIFPPELGLTARTAGKKGVLHTIWAKKRMSVLQKEIEQEMRINGESIGLEMAIQEIQWIEDNFGVGPRTVAETHPASPTSPKTPGGGRLSEKLKGLKLGTSPADLSTSIEPEPLGNASHLLSPDRGDIAVSSFSAFHGARPYAEVPTPPEQVFAKQDGSLSRSRMGSLDALAEGGEASIKHDNHDTEDGLFAVKLSPRSPDMTRSPFSFTTTEAAPWLKDRA